MRRESFFNQSTQTLTSNAGIELPKIIHFIWVGPDPIPLEAIKKIARWARENPSFQIWLWTDFKQFFYLKNNPSEKEEIKNIFEKYQHSFSFFSIELFLRKYDHTKQYEAAPIILKDISEEKLTGEIDQYELYRADPGFGPASDILRYKILYRYGGIYSDCRDIIPGTTSLEKSKIFGLKSRHELYIDHLSQKINVTEAELKNFQLDHPNNDFLITTRNNPLLALFSFAIEMKYHFDNKTSFDEILERCYGNIHKYYLTIKTTGGTLIGSQLSDIIPGISVISKLIVKYDKIVNKTRISILPVRCMSYSLYTPEDNKLSWLYTPLVKYPNQNNALENFDKTINFEINHFKILRLDDHSTHLSESLKIDKEHAAQLIIENIVNKIDLHAIELFAVQCTFQINTTEIFYKKNGLLSKNFLSLGCYFCSTALSYATNYRFLNEEWEKCLSQYDCEAYFNFYFSIEQVKVNLNQLVSTVLLVKSVIHNSKLNDFLHQQPISVIKNNIKTCFNIINLVLKLFGNLLKSNYFNNFNEQEKCSYQQSYNEAIILKKTIAYFEDKIHGIEKNDDYTDLREGYSFVC